MDKTICKLLLGAFLLILANTSPAESRNVTLEDIRDAMLSLIHMFRTSEDKLERHEYREKALGDQLKKTLAGLDKRQRTLEPLKGMLARLDERLSNVETVLMQKEEREKALEQKMNDVLSSLQLSLQQVSPSAKVAAESPAVENNLTTPDEDKLDSIQQDVKSIKDSLIKGCPGLDEMSETEKLLTKYETRLSEMNNMSRTPTDFVQLSEVTMADDAWHSKMSEVMERQEKEIEKIQRVLSNAEGMWKALPTREDLDGATNRSLGHFSQTTQDLVAAHAKGLTDIASKLSIMTDVTKSTNEDIQKSLTDGNTMNERLFGDISKGFDQLRSQMESLGKVDGVLLQTAEHVLENRKRIEYGAHQTAHDVGELVRLHTTGLNRTLNDRFDHIEATILDSQTGALANLTTKIETEMSQVWRQIGIMYQQLTASKTSLDRLQKQTEAYVNGSTVTMDSMENKVGLITSRMAEVDENLNYLLGRLSLVAQEFNKVKAGLGDTLDNIKSSFAAVKEQIKDAGPGPHKIESEEEVAPLINNN